MRVLGLSLSFRRGGEEITPIALLLALVGLFSLGVTGCKAPAPAPRARVRVDYDALLVNHPLWTQVLELDRISGQLVHSNVQATVVGTPLSDLPHPLESPPPVPATVAEIRQNRVRDYEATYLGQLAETLRIKDERYLLLRTRQLQKEAEAEYQKELATEMAGIRVDRLHKAQDLDRTITRLRFRDVPLQVQQKVGRGQSAQDAQIQHDILTRQIESLTRESEDLISPAIISDLAKQALRGRQETLLSAATAEVQKETSQLSTDRANRVTQERGKITDRIEPVSSIDRIALPEIGREQAPLVLSPLQLEAGAMRAALASSQQRVAQQSAVWKAQRDRMVAAIRADIEQASLKIAGERGWILYDGSARESQNTTLNAALPDETETIRGLLIQHWQPSR